jgi:hypothetical protein
MRDLAARLQAVPRAEEAGLAHQRHAQWWGRAAATQPTPVNRHHEPSALPADPYCPA